MSERRSLRPPVSNGMEQLGFGTWKNSNQEKCIDSVETALNIGYRHIDTAQVYGNESYVGEGIAESAIDRDEIFLATKVWIDNLSYEDVKKSVKKSLTALKTDYIDLLYVHYPSGKYDPQSTLCAFDELYEQRVIRNIGVSNFEIENIDTARDNLDNPIFANQIEFHPLLQQQTLRDVCNQHNINIVGYSPLMSGKLFDVVEIQEIAEKRSTDAASISLAWIREKGVAAIPKSSSHRHIKNNWESLDFSLKKEDIAKIDNIDRNARQVDEDFAPWNKQ